MPQVANVRLWVKYLPQGLLAEGDRVHRAGVKILNLLDSTNPQKTLLLRALRHYPVERGLHS